MLGFRGKRGSFKIKWWWIVEEECLEVVGVEIIEGNDNDGSRY